MDSTLILGLVCLCGVPIMAIFIGVVALIAIFYKPIEDSNPSIHYKSDDPYALSESIEAFTTRIRRILEVEIDEDGKRRRIEVSTQALLYFLPKEVGEITVKPGWVVTRFSGKPQKSVTWTLDQAESYAKSIRLPKQTGKSRPS